MSSPRRQVGVLEGLRVKQIHGGGLSSGIPSKGVVRNGYESDNTERPPAGGLVFWLLA